MDKIADSALEKLKDRTGVFGWFTVFLIAWGHITGLYVQPSVCTLVLNLSCIADGVQALVLLVAPPFAFALLLHLVLYHAWATQVRAWLQSQHIRATQDLRIARIRTENEKDGEINELLEQRKRGLALQVKAEKAVSKLEEKVAYPTEP
jgi:hypothetical protein